MPISQIIAAETSSLQFATIRATETISATGEGFSAYLARIMNPQTQEAFDDRWSIERRKSDDTFSYDSVPISTNEADSRSVAHDPDRSQPQVFNPDDGRRVSDAPKDRKPADDYSTVQPRESHSIQSHDGSDVASKGGAGQAERRTSQARGEKSTRSESVSGAEQTGKLKAASSRQTSVTATPSKSGARSPEASGADPMGKGAGTHKSVTTLAAQNETVAVGEISAAGQVAEIDVVLEVASGSARDDAKGPIIPDQQRADGKDRKGSQTIGVAGASLRNVNEAQSDERIAAGQKTRIAVNDLRGRGSREHGATNTSSDAAKNSQTSTTGQVAGLELTPGSADSFSSLFGVKGGAADGSAPRGVDLPTHSKTNSGMLSTLRQTLSDSVNTEIVRAARMVVRGNDTGEIRLHLKPETLGNVRIMLQMHEGHIAGRIIVENSSVREIFEQNLASLIKAFNESGLETGALDVTVADSGNGNQPQSDGRGAPQAIRELDRAVPLVQLLEDDHELVDLVV